MKVIIIFYLQLIVQLRLNFILQSSCFNNSSINEYDKSSFNPNFINKSALKIFCLIKRFWYIILSEKNMKFIIHNAESRGFADHGWLKSNHTFSFAGYYNPDRMGFGTLRVLNDDIVKPGFGFDTHQHANMEIVSVPLKGVITHKDSKGNSEDLHAGEVQIMSAGTGIFHSEYNNSAEELNFLQLWIYPKLKNIEPKYAQKAFDLDLNKNKFVLAVSPNSDTALNINQDAFISLASADSGTELNYKLNLPGNGVYIFLISGEAEIEGNTIYSRDGIGVYETDSVKINSLQDSLLLVVEIPMEIK